MTGMTFTKPDKEYTRYDYGKLWKHVGISYECKSCSKRFPDEEACKKHIEDEHKTRE